MRADEFINELENLIDRYNEENGVLINSLSINPHVVKYYSGKQKVLSHGVKFEVSK